MRVRFAASSSLFAGLYYRRVFGTAMFDEIKKFVVEARKGPLVAVALLVLAVAALFFSGFLPASGEQWARRLFLTADPAAPPAESVDIKTGDQSPAIQGTKGDIRIEYNAPAPAEGGHEKAGDEP
jgi:hypothetical protein